MAAGTGAGTSGVDITGGGAALLGGGAGAALHMGDVTAPHLQAMRCVCVCVSVCLCVSVCVLAPVSVFL